MLVPLRAAQLRELHLAHTSVGDTSPTVRPSCTITARPSAQPCIRGRRSISGSSGPTTGTSSTGQATSLIGVLARWSSGTDFTRPSVTNPAGRPPSSTSGNVENRFGNTKSSRNCSTEIELGATIGSADMTSRTRMPDRASPNLACCSSAAAVVRNHPRPAASPLLVGVSLGAYPAGHAGMRRWGGEEDTRPDRCAPL